MYVQVQPEILQSVDVEDVESALRSCLLKLQYANASLGPLRKGDEALLTLSCAPPQLGPIISESLEGCIQRLLAAPVS